MFMTCKSMNKEEMKSESTANAEYDHSTCDSSKCAQIPVTECTSCHKTPALNHTVTLAMDTEMATDQTEETAL